MDHPGFGIERQRLFEIVDRARVLLPGQRGPPETEQHRDRARLQRQRLHEQRLGLRRPPLIEIGIAQPHQRGQIVRLQLGRPLERRHRFRRVAEVFVQKREIVRPPRIGRRERLRIQKALLGGLPVFGRHQEPAHLAVRAAELEVRRARLLDGRHERRIAVAQLLRRPTRRRARDRAARPAAASGDPALPSRQARMWTPASRSASRRRLPSMRSRTARRAVTVRLKPDTTYATRRSRLKPDVVTDTVAVVRRSCRPS